MKKVISLLLVMLLLTATLSVSFSAYSVVDVDPDTGEYTAMTCAEAIAAYEAEKEMEPGSLGVQRIYFQMPNGQTGPTADEDVSVHHDPVLDPETGEEIEPGYDEVVIHAGEKAPTWFNDYNIGTDGKHYGGVYWWGSVPAACSSWSGYRMEIVDEAQGIYAAEIPYDEDDISKSVAIAIFNNGVDGGMDSSQPIYFNAAQTVDSNIEGAPEGDFDSLPYGSPDEYSYDGCILIIDPNQVSINDFSKKQECGWNPYVYYGNGCYGKYFEGCDEYTGDVDQDCCNPDHWVGGVGTGTHVGYQGGGEDPTEAPTDPPVHVHTPAAAVQENIVPATYKAGGSYDSVVYCSECGEEISRETVNTDPITLDPTKLYFDSTTTPWNMSTTKDKIGFYIFGGDLENELTIGARKLTGTAVADMAGLYSFDPTTVNYTLTPGVQYGIIFYHLNGSNRVSGDQTYDLLFTTDCLGHVGFCDGTSYENPVDSSQTALAAFWYDMDASVVGPVKQISSIGNVVGTCLKEGTTDESLFNDFLTVVDSTTQKTKYDNAMHYTVESGTKTEQQMIDDIGAGLSLTKQQVYDAFAAAGIETAWDYTVSTLPGEVTPPHTHTPADPVRENINVTHDLTTYDSVVYCSECGEELSRTPVEEAITTHTLTLVPEVPATEDATGVKAHYACNGCDMLFKDAEGKEEATAEWLVIPKLDHTHVPGTAVQENIVEADCEHGGSYDEVVYCTACHAEISRTPKTTDPLGHDTKFVPARAATEEAEGWKSHFKCKRCEKLFADKAATHPVTWDDVVIPKLQPAVTGKLGDVNNDGEVDIVDVTIIQRIDANMKLPTGLDPAIAAVLGDVDKDGEVTVLDATIIQRWLVGLEQNRGIGADV